MTTAKMSETAAAEDRTCCLCGTLVPPNVGIYFDEGLYHLSCANPLANNIACLVAQRDILKSQVESIRSATIEECAKMAETYMQNWEQGEHTAPAAHAIRRLASAEIAKSIRSLTKAGKGE